LVTSTSDKISTCGSYSSCETGIISSLNLTEIKNPLIRNSEQYKNRKKYYTATAGAQMEFGINEVYVS